MGILHMYRLSLFQPLVEFIIHFAGTLFCTQSAGNTLVHINIAGLLGNRNLEVTRYSRYAYYLRERE